MPNEEISKLLEDYFPTNGNENFIVPMFPNQIIWTNYLNYSTDPEKINIFLDYNGVWKTTRLVLQGEELLEDPSHHFDESGQFKKRFIDRNKNDYLNLRN
jgi:hypothetical protein